MSNSDLSSSVPDQGKNTRLCHIVKWDHFDGYGFNLHAEKGKPGQYIGKVDEGSPAESAGLRAGDRILEVNGESIADKTHKQVVEAIKALPNETKLLVIDPQEQQQQPLQQQQQQQQDRNVSPSPIPDITNSKSTPEKPVNSNNANNDATKETTENSSLNLNMTAAELRAKLKEKKKFDPKKETMDFKKKFEIVQKL